MSKSAQFRTHSKPSSAPHTVRSSRHGLPGIECRPAQHVQRPGVCAAPCVVCPGICPPWFWHGPPCLLLCAVVPGALGLGSPPAGYIAAAQPRPVSPSTTEKIKKAQKITLPPIVNLKNFPQKQKDPYKGSTFCAILALQALKGRNL
nr:MAG TPA: hypothetical protein [Caudoviricetes sp.]